MCILRNEIHKYSFNNILKAQFSFENMKKIITFHILLKLKLEAY